MSRQPLISSRWKRSATASGKTNWRQRSTSRWSATKLINPIERLDGEIKRRTEVVGISIQLARNEALHPCKVTITLRQLQQRFFFDPGDNRAASSAIAMANSSHCSTVNLADASSSNFMNRAVYSQCRRHPPTAVGADRLSGIGLRLRVISCVSRRARPSDNCRFVCAHNDVQL